MPTQLTWKTWNSEANQECYYAIFDDYTLVAMMDLEYVINGIWRWYILNKSKPRIHGLTNDKTQAMEYAEFSAGVR